MDDAYYDDLLADLLAAPAVAARSADLAPALRHLVRELKQRDTCERVGHQALLAWLQWSAQRRRAARRALVDTAEASKPKLAADWEWSVAVTANGRLHALGHQPPLPLPEGLNFRAVAAGCGHGIALTHAGAVRIWGAWSDPGPLEDASATQDDDGPFVAVTACYNFAAALREDGGVAVYGPNDRVRVPPGLPPLSCIGAGMNFLVGLTAEGNIVLWGDAEIRRKLWPRGEQGARFDTIHCDHLDPWRAPVAIEAGFEHFVVTLAPVAGYQACAPSVLTFGVTGVPRTLRQVGRLLGDEAEVKQVSCGVGYVLALCEDRASGERQLDCWRAPGYPVDRPTYFEYHSANRLHAKSTHTGAAAVCCGDYHCLWVSATQRRTVHVLSHGLSQHGVGCTLSAPVAAPE